MNNFIADGYKVQHLQRRGFLFLHSIIRNLNKNYAWALGCAPKGDGDLQILSDYVIRNTLNILVNLAVTFNLYLRYNLNHAHARKVNNLWICQWKNGYQRKSYSDKIENWTRKKIFAHRSERRPIEFHSKYVMSKGFANFEEKYTTCHFELPSGWFVFRTQVNVIKLLFKLKAK